MTNYSFRTLMLLFVLTYHVPKTNAQTYFSCSEEILDIFYNYGTTAFADGAAYWIQGAAANGIIFTLPATTTEYTTPPKSESNESLTYMISKKWTRGLFFDFEQNGAEYFSCESPTGYPTEDAGNYYYAGPGIATDQTETLWFTSIRSATAPQALQGNNAWAQGIKAVSYFKKADLPLLGQETTLYGIDLSNYNIGRSDLMSAYGDGANGEGYLWFCDETNHKVVRVKIVNGQAIGEIEFNSPKGTVVQRSLAVQYADNRVIYSAGRDGDKKIWRGVIDETKGEITWYDLGVTTTNNSGIGGSPGATMFIIGGYEYLAYSSSTTHVSIKVYDGTNPSNTTALETYTFSPFSIAGGASWMNHSINAVVSDDKMSADLYVYVPNRGAFKRKLTAIKSMGSIEEIKIYNTIPAVYYNLQGIKVSNPSNGVYIIKHGQKVTKQYVR